MILQHLPLAPSAHITRCQRWHTRLCGSWPRRAGLFILAFLAIAAWLVLLNSPHLGVNASLHWDAEASITYGPSVPDRAGLADARRHLYDVLPLIHSDDPALITPFYWSDKGLPFHGGLTQCRYYYSYVSDWIGHQAFLLGRRWFRSPVGAVLCYQLIATILTSLALSAMLLYVIVRLRPGRSIGIRLAIVGLTFAALSSTPVMLSLARQMLTETSGFTFLVATVLACSAMIAKQALPSAPPLIRAIGAVGHLIAAVFTGAFCFLTIRARYTLGPALAMLLPIVILLNISLPDLRRRNRSFQILAIVSLGMFFLLAMLDFHRFGSFFLPWVYDDVMVRSSRLLFHADPPYGDFLIALFINLPLLLICLIGVWCWIDQRDTGDHAIPRWQTRWCKIATALVILILALMLWRTAAQQVKLQGRHLFVFSATAIMLLLLVLPRIKWRTPAMVLYTIVTCFVLIWNCCSTFGAQRRHTLRYQPDVVTVITSHLSSAGATAKKSLARDLWNSYFDWADDRLLHDSLLTWNYVDHHRSNGALVLVDAAAAKANQFRFYADEFPTFQICQMHGRADPLALHAARAAINRGQTVFFFSAPGRQPPPGIMETEPIGELSLMSDSLRRVTRITPAAVYLDSGTTTSSTADGMTLALIQGKSKTFDSGFGYLPRAQQEYLTYDSDPRQVVYHLTGLRPGTQYELGFVTWDPDKLGRAMSVMAENPDRLELLSSEPIQRHALAGSAPTDIRVLLPSVDKNGRIRIIFENHHSSTDVVVCEIWAREVPRAEQKR